MNTLTYTVEIDLPERPALSNGWPTHPLDHWAANLLSNVADLLADYGIVRDSFAALVPVTNLGYGYHREQAALLDLIARTKLDPNLLDLVRAAGDTDPSVIIPGAHDRALITAVP